MIVGEKQYHLSHIWEWVLVQKWKKTGWLEFELTYSDVTIKHINHYTTKTSQWRLVLSWLHFLDELILTIEEWYITALQILKTKLFRLWIQFFLLLDKEKLNSKSE